MKRKYRAKADEYWPQAYLAKRRCVLLEPRYVNAADADDYDLRLVLWPCRRFSALISALSHSKSASDR
jgi:hypothetical protein